MKTFTIVAIFAVVSNGISLTQDLDIQADIHDLFDKVDIENFNTDLGESPLPEAGGVGWPKCGCVPEPVCECPHLQDAGIVLPCDDFGKLNFHAAQAEVSGFSREEFFPNVNVDSATATNVCGLDVSSTKLCGDITRHKNFCIKGNISVEETDSYDGCLGDTHCNDGRYTATKQHLSELKDADYCPDIDCLCCEASHNAKDASCC